MSSSGDFQPNWASLPGDTIADVLREREMPLNIFAKKMNSSIEYVKELIHGYISITDEIARSLEKVLGASKEFWLKREAKFQESKIRIEHLVEEKWVKDLPISDMVAFGWLEKSNNLVQDCLNYFGVPDVWSWKRKYSDAIALTAFRKSNVLKSIPESVSAWLRQGEIVANSIECKPWDPELFRKTLPELKKLTSRKKPKDFLNDLKDLCAKCGVAIAIIRTPKGCSASGATKFITADKAMILLSFRYLSDDHFWFTFFHEAGHLLLHADKSLFLEEENDNLKNNTYELEANDFAADVLIPKHVRERMIKMKIDKRAILDVAKEADVSLGIVIGQLQHMGRVDFKNLNGYKRRYTWETIV